MVRQAITRLVAAAGLTAAVSVLTLGASGPALAAPRPPTPTAVQITGDGVSGKIIVQHADQPRMLSTLYSEISWLSTLKPQTAAPAANKLGPKYTITTLVKNAATESYDLYPMAAGGPRVHRAANQPGNRKVTDGWFMGRLTMPESLRAGGVPLKAKPDVVNGGIGGGAGQDVKAGSADSAAGVNTFLEEIRRLVLLNGAVLMVILVGLAGIAFLVRRRV